MNDQSQLDQLISQAAEFYRQLDLSSKQQELNKLRDQTLSPDFWDKPQAQEIMQQIAWLQSQLDRAQELRDLKADLVSFQELLQESDQVQTKQLSAELEPSLAKLKALLKTLKIEKYLSGKFDQNFALLSIHPGQGGTEAQDWAEMLQRMYVRYFENKGWAYQLISETRGEEAGIKEVSFEVKAPYAYGYLKGERGTHRLVRLSPFNADNLRQTSFALVEVLPVVNDNQQLKIKDADLSWHFTRSSGAGGQSVNKVNSAVELTHEPTGIVVKCRQERSQVQNKEQALKILRAKLAQRYEQQVAKQIHQARGQHQDASWGTQIRNYVLHPYQLVKDTRTEVETNDTQGVLAGDLDQFILEEIKLT